MGKKKSSKWLKWLTATVIVVVLAIGAAAFWGWRVAGAEHEGEPVWLHVATGSTPEQVADSVNAALGYQLGHKVMRLWQLQGGKPSIASGAYKISAGENALAISRRLLHGLQTPVKVTFNNARTMQQLANKVSAWLEIDADAFLQACDSVLPAAGFDPAQYPAAFIPDSYEFYWNVKPKALVERLLGYRNKYWNDDRRKQAKSLGLTPVQVATLASIVEEETARADEKGKVARLYLNRINKGMLLQADPTVKYAVGDFGLRRILNKHLDVESPYNTYKHRGLPPGPIRVPAASTLDAVLSAPMHSYLYMCAKDDFSGYHNFATDYGTHMQNARRYQQALNRRGIK